MDRTGYHRHMRRKHVSEKNAPILSELRAIHEKHPEYEVKCKQQVLSVQYSYGKIYKLCKEGGLLQKRYKRPNSLTKSDPKAQLLADGKLYISGIMDCFDGAIAGLSMHDHMCAELCTAALQAAVKRYGKQENLLFHSDQGCQYTNREYRNMLDKYGIRQSMGRTGSCFDNARMKSFWASLKKDLLYRLPLSSMTKQEVKQAVFRWIECHYHWQRPYSGNPSYLPPLRYRKLRMQNCHGA